MISHSDSIGSLMAAILAVQQDVDHVEKGAKNPHFGNTYADLNTFLRALRGPLAEHGIVMTQAPGMDEGTVTVETMLVHESGEWIRNRAAAPMQKNDPQGVGSAITYLRRYSLAALFAVPQEDDDGNAASRKQSNGRSRRNRSARGEVVTWPERLNALFTDRFPDSPHEKARAEKAFRVAHPKLPDVRSEWTQEHYRTAVAQIKKALSNDDDPFQRALDAFAKIQAEKMTGEKEDEDEEPEPVGAGADGELPLDS